MYLGQFKVLHIHSLFVTQLCHTHTVVHGCENAVRWQPFTSFARTSAFHTFTHTISCPSHTYKTLCFPHSPPRFKWCSSCWRSSDDVQENVAFQTACHLDQLSIFLSCRNSMAGEVFWLLCAWAAEFIQNECSMMFYEEKSFWTSDVQNTWEQSYGKESVATCVDCWH